MNKVLYIKEKPTEYKNSNYYQRRVDFINELNVFINHARAQRKHICLSDLINFFKCKYGFSTKNIRDELIELEKQEIIMINDDQNLIKIFFDLEKEEAETEANLILGL